jgi:hypothetical protein
MLLSPRLVSPNCWPTTSMDAGMSQRFMLLSLGLASPNRWFMTSTDAGMSHCSLLLYSVNCWPTTLTELVIFTSILLLLDICLENIDTLLFLIFKLQMLFIFFLHTNNAAKTKFSGNLIFNLPYGHVSHL